MTVNVVARLNRGKDKKWYTLEFGKKAGQRFSTGVFTFTKPKTQVEKNHNKEALTIIEHKKSQLILEGQAIGSGYLPNHRVHANFLDFFDEYIKDNKRSANRHLACSLASFKKFLGKKFVPPIEITENLCQRFRNYLLERLNGETPAQYFMCFKRILKNAKKQGYFRENPAEEIRSKNGRVKNVKNILNEDEYRSPFPATDGKVHTELLQ